MSTLRSLLLSALLTAVPSTSSAHSEGVVVRVVEDRTLPAPPAGSLEANIVELAQIALRCGKKEVVKDHTGEIQHQYTFSFPGHDYGELPFLTFWDGGINYHTWVHTPPNGKVDYYDTIRIPGMSVTVGKLFEPQQGEYNACDAQKQKLIEEFKKVLPTTCWYIS